MDTTRILLTGGTGFFGRALLRMWMQQACAGHAMPSVCVLSRDPSAFLDQYNEFDDLGWLSFFHGDVLNRDTLPWDELFTHIIHAATESTKGPLISPLSLFQQIVDGTRNILDLAVKTSATRFLLTSSGAIYGPQPPEISTLPEDYPGSPDSTKVSSAYGLGKRAAEHLCILYQNRYTLEPVIARCFAFVGQDLPLQAHYAIGNFLSGAMYNECILVKGDGSPLRSYMHQEDLAYWLFRILVHGRPGEAYNVGSDQAITIKDLALLTRDLISPDKPVCILNNQTRSLERNLYVPSIKKARDHLGLQVSVPLKEAILRTVKTLRGS